ncbi:uncharacterized protein L201_002241 [Kwoniella dendrophila CBS 6074]|uniref:Uncharacterized protein n=1 Tax=Kwoniella dendrophila CBS 6074 TaxID=1295534 RepID=A0AAX4JPM1_9TREE
MSKLFPLKFVWMGIDKIVDGKLTVIKSKDHKRKYIIPSCSELIYYPKYDSWKHGKKKENYKDLNYLIKSARLAIENGDSQPFYRIFCLISEVNKQHNGSSGCSGSSELKHLNYEPGKQELKRLIKSDQKSMKSMKNYAWLMESMMPSPMGNFRLGTSSLFMTIPFLGSIVIFLMNFLMLKKTFGGISAPRWLIWEIILPLLWASFFAFAIPELGDLAASRISPNRRAARKLKYYLKLRCILAFDQKDSLNDNLYVSNSLSQIFPRLPSDKQDYIWKYNEEFRREVFGKDLKHLLKKKGKNYIHDKV